MLLKILSLLLVVLVGLVLSQDIPLWLDGALDDATADDDTFNTGGTISVNGWTVKVPKNMLVTFPAAFVPWKDFVANKSAVLGFEVNVAGNIVNGVSLAAQIIVAEFAMEINQGYVGEVNFDGTMKIVNGPTIRINDPNAVFSAGYSYPFMVADDVSPSVSSFSGFPMCVPRSSNDTLCPMSNRPTVPGTTNPRRIFQAPDPMIMAPFVPGDFIVYRGFHNKATNELICFEIVAWGVQITTVGVPTYIRVEETLIGVYTSDTSGEVAETRFVGYTSDPSVTVSITAIDIDPCTGRTSERAVGAGQQRPEAGGRNKWISRIDGDVRPTAYTREYKVTASLGTRETRNGIISGQYVFPILEWIQPELLVPGSPPLVNEYSQFTHLTKGVGPDGEGNIFGPLDPFPQSGVQVFDISTCPEITPPEGDPDAPIPKIVASIGTTVTNVEDSPLLVRAEDTFVLRGSQTNTDPIFSAPGAGILSYTWTVVANESAGAQSDLQTFTLSSDNKTATLKFRSTALTGDYVFQLAIEYTSPDDPQISSTGTSTFTVSLFSGPDEVTIEAVTWTSGQSGTIGVVCKSNYRVDSRVAMQVTHPGDGAAQTASMTASPPGSGSWSFSSRRVDRPGTVTCRSNLGGSATRSGTTAKKRAVGGARRGGLKVAM